MRSADQSVSGHGEMCKCIWSVDHYTNAEGEMSGHKPYCAHGISARNLIFFVFFIIVAASDAAFLSTLYSPFRLCPSSKILTYLDDGEVPKMDVLSVSHKASSEPCSVELNNRYGPGV